MVTISSWVTGLRTAASRRRRLVRLTPRARAVAEVADAEVEQVLAEWADHVGARRLQQVHDVLRDLREILDPWA